MLLHGMGFQFKGASAAFASKISGVKIHRPGGRVPGPAQGEYGEMRAGRPKHDRLEQIPRSDVRAQPPLPEARERAGHPRPWRNRELNCLLANGANGEAVNKNAKSGTRGMG